MELPELLNQSLNMIQEKRDVTKEMNDAFKNVASCNDMDPAVLRRVKDYTYYKGNGWLASPLELDKDEKYKDRVSPTFKKLAQIVEDLATVDNLDLLDEYLEAMAARGINIDISRYVPETKAMDVESCKAVIDSGCSFQKEICELADSIKETDAEVAEGLGFGPKSEYNKLVNMSFSKSRKGKDISDKVNDEYVKHEMAAKSYQTVSINEF